MAEEPTLDTTQIAAIKAEILTKAAPELKAFAEDYVAMSDQLSIAIDVGHRLGLPYSNDSGSNGVSNKTFEIAFSRAASLSESKGRSEWALYQKVRQILQEHEVPKLPFPPTFFNFGTNASHYLGEHIYHDVVSEAVQTVRVAKASAGKHSASADPSPYVRVEGLNRTRLAEDHREHQGGWRP